MTATAGGLQCLMSCSDTGCAVLTAAVALCRDRLELEIVDYQFGDFRIKINQVCLLDCRPCKLVAKTLFSPA